MTGDQHDRPTWAVMGPGVPVPPVEAVLAEALVIHPGDRVLIALRSDDITEEDADEAREKLLDRFPGADFTFLSGVEGLAALRGDHP